MNNLLLCLTSQGDAQTTHRQKQKQYSSLEILAIKGNKVLKEKLKFVLQTWLQYLGYSILEQGLNLDSDRL